MTVLPILRGGLSNCLFGMATAIAYSLKHNIYYYIPTQIENPHYEGQQVMRSPYIRYLDGNIDDLVGNVTVYYEPHFHYKEIPKFNCDYLILNGYFQSHLFFDEYRTEIMHLLNIPYEYKEGYVAIHVRRGDYLKIPNCHPPVSLKYIHEAIESFSTTFFYKKFIIFSDDIDYCYKNIEQPYDCHFEFSEGRTELEDLSLASSCEHSIGSNSAYSWWIYWLNQNKYKAGIFPEKDKWFGKDLKHCVDDLYMEEWVLY